MILRSHGIAYGSTAKALILDPAAEQFLMSKKASTSPTPNESLSRGDVALWGDNNLAPQEMMKDIENTGVLSAALDLKARATVGRGPMLVKVVGIGNDLKEQYELVNDPEVADWMETSNCFLDTFAAAKDIMGLGIYFDEAVLTKDRSKIYGFRRHDATECRLSKISATSRRSEYVYISSDWQRYANFEEMNEHQAKVPLLDGDFPFLDLAQRTTGHNFFITGGYPLFGRKYYPMPLWWPARKWVKMAQAIPDLKKAMVNNQMNINYIVEIHPKFWENYSPKWNTAKDAKEKIAIMDEFYDKVDKYLTGAENSYKSLFSTMITAPGEAPVPAIKITSLEDKLKEGKLLVDSAAANSEILFALMMNPAIIGADTPGGPYSGGAGSGSNIRESFLSQVILQEVERKIISKRFQLAKQYNGWDPAYVIRYPNQLLTTLDTGATSKPTA